MIVKLIYSAFTSFLLKKKLAKFKSAFRWAKLRLYKPNGTNTSEWESREDCATILCDLKGLGMGVTYDGKAWDEYDLWDLWTWNGCDLWWKGLKWSRLANSQGITLGVPVNWWLIANSCNALPSRPAKWGNLGGMLVVLLQWKWIKIRLSENCSVQVCHMWSYQVQAESSHVHKIGPEHLITLR